MPPSAMKGARGQAGAEVRAHPFGRTFLGLLAPFLKESSEAVFLVEEALRLVPVVSGVPIPVGVRVALRIGEEDTLEPVRAEGEAAALEPPCRIAFEQAVPQWVVGPPHAAQVCPAVEGVADTHGVVIPFEFHGRKAGVLRIDWERHETALEPGVLAHLEFLAQLVGLAFVASALSGSLDESRLRRDAVEDLYRRALEQADVVAYQRVNGIPGFYYAGEGMRELTGYEVHELSDDVWRSLLLEIHPRVGEHGTSLSELHRKFHSGILRIWRADYKVRRRDGTVRWLADTSVQTSEGGQVTGSLGILQDITERKEHERHRQELAQRLRQSQHLESLGTLAGGIAHDFNNILAGILGNASLALMDLGADSALREPLQQIEQAALRAADLTNQMLAFAGKASMKRERVDLARLAADVSRLAESSVLKKTPVAVVSASGLPPVVADSAQVRQALLNLLVNAAEAMEPEPGIVTVEVGKFSSPDAPVPCAVPPEPLPPGPYLTLSVRDTGVGIPPDSMRRLFEPFYTTRELKRGLGLAAVSGIMTAHEGGVQVETVPGAGTTFRLLFPFPPALPAGAEAPDEGDSSASRPWNPSGLVLVADDDATVRGLACRLLVRAGFETMDAEDGGAAIHLFNTRPDDVVAAVLDIRMPRAGGIDVLEHLRRHSPNLPIVLISGYDETHFGDSIGSDPRTAFIKKPFRPSELRAALRRIMSR